MFDRSFWVPAGTLFAAGLLVSSAGATPVTSVKFTDGEVLNVQAVIGSGTSAAYLAVNFDSGSSEAFEYKFNGTTDGYSLLTALAGTIGGAAGPTTLNQSGTYYGAPFNEHLISELQDGTNTVEYPDLYFSPPLSADNATEVTSTQGITYEYPNYGTDEVAIGNGTILAYDVYGSGAPVLPEAAVPEPVSVTVLGVLGVVGLFKRRR